MMCKVQYCTTPHLLRAVFWTAPAPDHASILLDVDKFLYQICDKLGLRFVCVHYLRKVHVTLILSLRLSHLPNSCKGFRVFCYKCVYIKLRKEKSSFRSKSIISALTGNK